MIGREKLRKEQVIPRQNNPQTSTPKMKIKPAAPRRGVAWHVGTQWNNSRYPDSGNLFVRDTNGGPGKDLGGTLRLVTISPVRTKVDAADAKAGVDPRPYLAIFGAEQDSSLDPQPQRPGAVYHNRRNGDAHGLFGRWPLDRNSGLAAGLKPRWVPRSVRGAWR
jgi:hypothetical protein